jgi:hypothetical protein
MSPMGLPQMNWKALPTTFDLPYDAVALGQDSDGATLYACRVPFNNGVHPGKTRYGWNGACNIGWGGQEYSLQGGQALVPAWAPASNGGLPAVGGAIALGHESNGTPTYTCRVYAHNGLQLGKLHVGFTGCFVPYGGKEEIYTGYEVLIRDNAPGRIDYVPVQTAPGLYPPASLIGGYDTDGQPLYMCIGSVAGDMAPGKTRRNWNVCSVSWGGSEILTNNYQVVTAKFTNGATPAYAQGGQEADGTPLGMCFVPLGGSVQVGKYINWGVCDFGYGGQEYQITSGYSVLTY